VRRSPLKRRTSLQAGCVPPRRGAVSPATPTQRAKVRDRACIVCDAHPCDPAHLIDRSLAPSAGDDSRAVVPLCRRCHREYDDGQLDLLPHLEPRWREEIAFAVEAVGLLSALRRITGQRWAPVVERLVATSEGEPDG
jgi:hypothetical protein